MPTETRSPRRQAKVDLDRLRVLTHLDAESGAVRARELAAKMTRAEARIMPERHVTAVLEAMLTDHPNTLVLVHRIRLTVHGRPWAWRITPAGRDWLAKVRKGDA
jgi:hypothetical protein